MTRRLLILLTFVMLAGGVGHATGRPGVHQDAPRLTWLTPGFLPPDGLLSVGLRGGGYDLSYRFAEPDKGISRYKMYRFGVFADWSPLSWVALSWSQEWRSWSGYYVADALESGSGLADGALRAAVAVPGLPGWLGLVGWGGGNIPLGGPETGEEAFSKDAGGTIGLRFWSDSQLPEMRIHVSLGRRWNANEAQGYGAGLGPDPQPWWFQYPDAASAGGDANNDFLFWGLGLEFRQASTSLWLEYHEYELEKARHIVWDREDQKVLSAGVRWGLEEGWALHADYQVGFQRDEPWFTDWYPRHVEWAMNLGVSRQFAVGGRDRDGDGIPDRRDQCPDEPEDIDGFEDEDGCRDPDNDQDGVPDHMDYAPMDPEDFDGFMDEDGVPDPDNDNDGILDHDDECPDEAEDFDGDRDEDGCPEEFRDRDGDGIGDDEDLCPDSPEDPDGFQDGDGCPDPDNDFDGIDDVHDACPDEPEDYDGDRDSDGCPDLTEEEQKAKEAEEAEEETEQRPAPPPRRQGSG